MITIHLIGTFIVHVIITVVLIEMFRFFLVQNLEDRCFRTIRSSVLSLSLYLQNFVVRSTFMWFVVFGVLEQDLVHICRRVLEKFIRGIEDDQCDFTVTENAELVGLLHQAELPLGECHLSIPLVGDLRDLNLFSSHSATTERVSLMSTIDRLSCLLLDRLANGSRVRCFEVRHDEFSVLMFFSACIYVRRRVRLS